MTKTSPYYGPYKAAPVKYRVRRVVSDTWSPWGQAITVAQGLGWIQFDDARFDSTWVWECGQDIERL